MVHPGGERGVRGPDGGRARPLRRGARPGTAGGLPGRAADRAPRPRRPPLPPAPGRPARGDYEYERRGTGCLAAAFDPHRGWRHAWVGERRTAVDFAGWLKDLSALRYPEAAVIRLVADNLNTHGPGALYGAFPAEEAHGLARRFEWHHTPPHGSWLSMVEVELSVLADQCLNRRLPDLATVAAEVAAWEAARNAAAATVEWRFTTAAARSKLHRLYPHPNPQ